MRKDEIKSLFLILVAAGVFVVFVSLALMEPGRFQTSEEILQTYHARINKEHHHHHSGASSCTPSQVHTGPTTPNQLLYQFPNTTAACLASPHAITGILLLLHGCGHGAYDWFDPGECVGCVGLPEERAIVRVALRRGMAVAALSSVDREFSKCWDGEDAGAGTLAIEYIRKKHNIPLSVPAFVFGASSGGAYASTMGSPADASRLNIAAITIQIAPAADPDQISIPTLFIHMPSDTHTAGRVHTQTQQLRSRGIVTAELECNSLPMSPSLLTSRIRGMPLSQAQRVFDALVNVGLVDVAGNWRDNPRGTDWQTAVRAVMENGRDEATWVHDSLIADRSPISEVLNRAFAGHEICSDHSEAMLDFMLDPEGMCRDSTWQCHG